MIRGIYIVANDRVIENAIALLNSIRYYDQEVLIYLIPFNENYHKVADKITTLHNVQIFPDLELIEKFTLSIGEIFDRDFLALPNKMRKLVAWFGPLDEFIYIDTDIVVFEKIADNLDKLTEVDFFCCDYHHANDKLRNIFSPLVREQQIFTDAQLEDVFNSGFWASRKGTITEQQMDEALRECATHREYFDFSEGVTDQPILNYLVLKLIAKRGNLVKIPGGGPGSWAGSRNFQQQGYTLYDRGQPLKYLHWAGTKMKIGSPYWQLWEHYRYLHQGKFAIIPKLTRRLFPFVVARN
ncbi:Npun_R2821/Npun_R2822 family protein [Cylindrospermum sp. FACHB-282]|uniref:Npun_R2821/Npun_R2822 family protein n=1 Tax=Cylindrospermum sp. FACHB-282 TaxID=2692794 RepID=UPI001682E1C2|nr:Npun_R2821/Npun_R2822 family protein [Cylindrospermum sp. FACHB-282]MBD2388061.1 methionine synthase [Cylindrospermum sp. FACHB-282]